MPFRVLFVCTGNVCRSPAAELIFAHRADGHDMASASAGTGGLTGRGVDEPTALALRDIGVDPSSHSARRLTAGLVQAADLILTADTEHRAVVVRETPSAFRRAFTLREFARLAAALPSTGPDDGSLPDVAALRARVAEVADQRGWVEPAEPGGDDVGDPFGAGLDLARETVATIADTVDAILAGLGARPLVADEPAGPDEPADSEQPAAESA